MAEITPITAAVQNSILEARHIQRLFHGRGQTFPGLEQITVDWYPPAIFICLFRPVEEAWLESLVDALWRQKADGVKSIVVQHRQGPRTCASLVRGDDLPSPHIVAELDTQELLRLDEKVDTHKTHLHVQDIVDTHTLGERYDDIAFYVNLLNAQNVGIFPDMVNGRAWVRHNSFGKNVLNLFSYTCLFSVAAIAGGAEQVINVDMNKSVMSQGRLNHKINNLSEQKAKFFCHNIFNSWGKIRRHGPYDLIIIDPPSFQKGSFALTKDYQKLIKKLPELAGGNARVMLCLNAPDIDSRYLLDLVAEHCPELQYIGRLSNCDKFPELDQEKSLKVQLFKF